ncbi:MAG: hypothetical protein ACKODX_21775 [Gemmata sp.]|jgi:hypothetical protein
MNPTVYVTPPLLNGPLTAAPAQPELADLLRQLLAVQQEQVALMKAQAAAQANRWKALLARWAGEFGDLGPTCGQAVPAVERAYLAVAREVAERLATDADGLGDEFVLTEFLDRYGTRLTLLGNILTQLATLADAAPTEKG